MEKNFTNAILLSATVLVAFMIVYPPMHLSAQNANTIDASVKVRKVTVESVNYAKNSMVVFMDGDEDQTIEVTTNASTTFFFGNGDEADLPVIRPGMNVYLFGTYDSKDEEIRAEKIVIRNKRVTERTSPSRAETARASLRKGLQPNTPEFNLLGTEGR